jgi:hypothetical protein
MIRGPLNIIDYHPRFSGHETFPLRYGWLKKSFDAVAAEGEDASKSVFLGDDAIARFGVGKNMVAAMRHWAKATGILVEEKGLDQIKVTRTGDKLLGAKGLDPYMEHPATLWLVHWHLSGLPELTTWFWAFNHFTHSNFERDSLVKGLEKFAKNRGWSRVASTTVRRDIECFLRTYVARSNSRSLGHEDLSESPLTELGLIRPSGSRDGYRFVRGSKPSLGQGVFIHALVNFWMDYSDARSLSFEAIAHEPGSPGRIFLLDEDALAQRLVNLDQESGGVFQWSETAGLKQVLRNSDLSSLDTLNFIERDYCASVGWEAA